MAVTATARVLCWEKNVYVNIWNRFGDCVMHYKRTHTHRHRHTHTQMWYDNDLESLEYRNKTQAKSVISQTSIENNYPDFVASTWNQSTFCVFFVIWISFEWWMHSSVEWWNFDIHEYTHTRTHAWGEKQREWKRER